MYCFCLVLLVFVYVLFDMCLCVSFAQHVLFVYLSALSLHLTYQVSFPLSDSANFFPFFCAHLFRMCFIHNNWSVYLYPGVCFVLCQFISLCIVLCLNLFFVITGYISLQHDKMILHSQHKLKRKNAPEQHLNNVG